VIRFVQIRSYQRITGIHDTAHSLIIFAITGERNSNRTIFYGTIGLYITKQPVSDQFYQNKREFWGYFEILSQRGKPNITWSWSINTRHRGRLTPEERRQARRDYHREFSFRDSKPTDKEQATSEEHLELSLKIRS